MSKRITKIKINAIASLLYQLITIICGFILPRLILSTFGSSYNGLTSSITQFVSCVTLLSAGIGGVTRAALYKPLAQQDNKTISIIVKTTQAFMRKVALIFAVALIIFASIYPLVINKEFKWFFSFTLIIIIGSSTFFTNFFGITYQLLLRADQKNYIILIIQSGTVIANTIVASCLLLNGFGLHIVKLGSALVYIAQPFITLLYCKRYYRIDTSVQPDGRYIAQRWDAFAQRIALFVHSNTDVIVLSAFMTLVDVSIYSVYSYIILGIEQIIKSLCIGVDAAFGNLLISTDSSYIGKKFEEVEYTIFSITTILFTATALLIAPFVSLYTKGINDANYHQPLFAMLFILSEMFFCIRTPYQDLVEASGAFKDMRNGALAEMFINICLSVVLVNTMGLVGVVLGTLIAMIFRTLQYVVYLRRHILNRPIHLFFRRIGIMCLISVVAYIASKILFSYECTNYFQWALTSMKTVAVIGVTWILVSLVFDKKNMRNFFKFLKIV